MEKVWSWYQVYTEFYTAAIFAISPQTQDVNWTYLRRLEDVLDVFWTTYVRSI